MAFYMGALYNNYLKKQMDSPTEDLRQTIREWDEKSLVGRILSCFNLFGEDLELKAKAARDLIAAREDPEGEIAQKINWKLDSYRAEK